MKAQEKHRNEAKEMRVRVYYYGLIRSKLGKKEEEVELKSDASLSELFGKLVRVYGKSLRELFQVETENILDPSFIVTVNGILMDRLQGIKTKLHEGDKIALMTIVSGG